MGNNVNIKEPTTKRINGYLHKVIPIADASGKILSYSLKPLMVEFKPRDIIQVVVGSAVLAIPVAFTEEVWELGEILPKFNIALIATLSMLFISIFVYFNFYRFTLNGHVFDMVKRVVGTYIISFLVVGLLLTLLNVCPWGTDNLLAIKRIVLVAFPASLGGTLSDTIK